MMKKIQKFYQHQQIISYATTQTFKITKLTKKGTYKTVIEYNGNSYYKNVTKNIKIKIM